jgi:hypothetical protein
LIQPKEAWELCLNALAGLQSSPQPAPAGATLRLIWSIALMGEHWEIQPREQKINAKGGWSKGRNVAIKRLSQSPGDFGYLTPQDLRICQQIESGYSSYRYYGQVGYEFNDKAIVALIGHPLVFWGDSATRIEIVKGEPELLVKKSKQNWLTLEFSPKIKENKDILVIKETPTRLKVIEVSPDHLRIAKIIGVKNRLEVPESAKEQVLSAINAVSGEACRSSCNCLPSLGELSDRRRRVAGRRPAGLFRITARSSAPRGYGRHGIAGGRKDASDAASGTSQFQAQYQQSAGLVCSERRAQNCG